MISKVIGYDLRCIDLYFIHDSPLENTISTLFAPSHLGGRSSKRRRSFGICLGIIKGARTREVKQ